MFDKYKGTISGIENFDELNRALDKMDIPAKFREYASRVDGITCSAQEWKESEEYMLPQLRALIGRYSRLGDNAFYKMYLGVDTTIKKAIESD
jgi:carboxyl-terminal processing protease